VDERARGAWPHLESMRELILAGAGVLTKANGKGNAAWGRMISVSANNAVQ
jgi:hypothetical protein